MFKCQKCSKSTDRPTRVVIERKHVDHLKGADQGPNEGKGTQIVKEISVCLECLATTPEAYKPERVVLVAKKPERDQILDTNHAA